MAAAPLPGRCCVRRLLLLLLGHSTPAWLPALLALLPWPLLPRPAQGVHASVITLAQPDPRNRIPASNMHTPGRRKWLWPLHAQRLRQRSRRPWLRKGWRIVAELQRRDAEQRGMRGDRWWRCRRKTQAGRVQEPLQAAARVRAPDQAGWQDAPESHCTADCCRGMACCTGAACSCCPLPGACPLADSSVQCTCPASRFIFYGKDGPGDGMTVI